jgi:hypothetical protein
MVADPAAPIHAPIHAPAKPACGRFNQRSPSRWAAKRRSSARVAARVWRRACGIAPTRGVQCERPEGMRIPTAQRGTGDRIGMIQR